VKYSTKARHKTMIYVIPEYLVEFRYAEIKILPVTDLYQKAMFMKLNDRTGVVVSLIHHNDQ